MRDSQFKDRADHTLIHEEVEYGEQTLMYYHDAPDVERRGVYSLNGGLEERHEAYLVDWDAEDEDEIIYDEDLEARNARNKEKPVGSNQRGRYASDLDDIGFGERAYSDILLQEVVTEGRLNREIVEELDDEKRKHILNLADQKGIEMQNRGSEEITDDLEDEHPDIGDRERTDQGSDGPTKGKKKEDRTQVEEILWEDGE